MCKLALITREKTSAPQFERLVRAQYEAIRDQPHGCSAFVRTLDGQVHIFRELADYDKVFSAVDELLSSARTVVLHTRVSTCGAISLENVHMFEHKGVIFAHNGFVEGAGRAQVMGFQPSTHYRLPYVPVKEWDAYDNSWTGGGASDSLRFLRKMPRVLTVQSLREYAGKELFSGMGFVFDRASSRAFLLAYKRIHILSDGSTAGIFSYEPRVKMDQIKRMSIVGVDALSTRERVRLEFERSDAVEGTYALKI